LLSIFFSRFGKSNKYRQAKKYIFYLSSYYLLSINLIKIYKTIILPVVLYESLTIKKERRLRVSEKGDEENI